MKIKFDVRKHIVKNIILYIAGILIIPTITCYAIHAKNLAKDYEKFSVVSGVEITEENNLRTVIEKDETILESSIFARKYDEQFYTYMESRLINADIIILPNIDEAISETMMTSFVEIKNDDFVYDDSNYQVNNKHYGIKLNNYSNLDSQFDFNDNECYMFIKKSSVHIKHWNNEAKTDLVFNVIKEYLS